MTVRCYQDLWAQVKLSLIIWTKISKFQLCFHIQSCLVCYITPVHTNRTLWRICVEQKRWLIENSISRKWKRLSCVNTMVYIWEFTHVYIFCNNHTSEMYLTLCLLCSFRFWRRLQSTFRSRMTRSTHREAFCSPTPSREACESYPTFQSLTKPRNSVCSFHTAELPSLVQL